MRRHLSLITLIISSLIVVIGYFSYSKFIRPTYINSEKRSVKIDLQKGNSVILQKLPNQSGIYQLEFELKGNTNASIEIELMDHNKIPTERILLKGGKINYLYAGDWYDNVCHFSIKDNPENAGQLEIEYRFLGLNN